MYIQNGVKILNNRKKYTKTNVPTLIVREVVHNDIVRMKQEAERYFYIHNHKEVLIDTQTLYQYMITIIQEYKISDYMQRMIWEGLKQVVIRELVGHFNRRDIKEEEYKDKTGKTSPYFKVKFRNANYLDISGNKKKNNTIGDYRKVMTSMRLDPLLKQDIQAYCRQRGTTMSNLTDRLYRQLLEKQEGDDKELTL
ncbi:hypothetical protein WH51_14175 [Bacilli bacterium VT-13-104]|nr:hypothetical protein WH51_14175 [Bacilli bacterium VT-13-104]